MRHSDRDNSSDLRPTKDYRLQNKGVNVEHAPQALETHHDAPRYRQRAADVARARAAGDERQAKIIRDPHQRADLRMVGRKHNRVRRAPVRSLIPSIEFEYLGLDVHARTAERVDQRVLGIAGERGLQRTVHGAHTKGNDATIILLAPGDRKMD